MLVSNTTLQLATSLPTLADDLLDLFHRIARNFFCAGKRLGVVVNAFRRIFALPDCRAYDDDLYFTPRRERQPGDLCAAAHSDLYLLPYCPQEFLPLHSLSPLDSKFLSIEVYLKFGHAATVLKSVNFSCNLAGKGVAETLDVRFFQQRFYFLEKACGDGAVDDAMVGG